MTHQLKHRPGHRVERRRRPRPRQRYWGEPIPIYFPVELADPTGDPRRGAAHTIRYDQPLAVDESELPLRLPELAGYNPGEDPAGPLARVGDWRFFQRDGRWDNDKPWTMDAYDAWMPVDLKPFARAEVISTGKGLLGRVAFVVAGAGFEPAHKQRLGN